MGFDVATLWPLEDLVANFAVTSICCGRDIFINEALEA